MQDNKPLELLTFKKEYTGMFLNNRQYHSVKKEKYNRVDIVKTDTDFDLNLLSSIDVSSIDDKINMGDVVKTDFDLKLLSLIEEKFIYEKFNFKNIEFILSLNGMIKEYDLSKYENYFDKSLKISWEYDTQRKKYFYIYFYDKDIAEECVIYSDKENKEVCPQCGTACNNFNSVNIYDNYLCLDVNYDKKLKIIKNLEIIKKMLSDNNISISDSNISNSFYCRIKGFKTRVSDHKDTGNGRHYYGKNKFDFIVTDKTIINIKITLREML